ncbi:hypothetical protein BMS3Abin02_02402 [bacterium BMS3Abin02]|nr:hypothetical protein BMS3Abin02_02402 [bacterium BMS3Abin02]
MGSSEVMVARGVEHIDSFPVRGTPRVGYVVPAAIVLVLIAGVIVGFVAIRDRQGIGDEPRREAAIPVVAEYQRALAEGDLDTYRSITKPMLGTDLAKAFAVERGCLNWNVAVASFRDQEISPYVAQVTFSDGDRSLVRTLMYESNGWIVTVQPNCRLQP